MQSATSRQNTVSLWRTPQFHECRRKLLCARYYTRHTITKWDTCTQATKPNYPTKFFICKTKSGFVPIQSYNSIFSLRRCKMHPKHISTINQELQVIRVFIWNHNIVGIFWDIVPWLSKYQHSYDHMRERVASDLISITKLKRKCDRWLPWRTPLLWWTRVKDGHKHELRFSKIGNQLRAYDHPFRGFSENFI